jgi:hypothetical protein
VIVGKALVQTVRHFFPDLNRWLDRLPDARVAEACTYPTRFLAWWGLLLFLLQLRSRRQLDYELDAADNPQLLPNLNRLAQTHMTTRPVHDTLDYFLGKVALTGWERLREQFVQRILRMKVFDAARLLGRAVVIIDATGVFCFQRRHCEHCLTQRHGKKILYMHHVLEAKLLGPAGVVISLGSEFIDNTDVPARAGQDAEQIKQDCELKALARLLPRIRASLPQLSIVLALDNLYACGPAFALAEAYRCSYVVTFKEGRTPALWREYRALLKQCPNNVVVQQWDDGRRQEYRWVRQLEHEDSQGRRWSLNALECRDKPAKAEEQYFAWLTPLPVTAKTVAEIAAKGGRSRWTIENEGFNRQKNSGLNLEHVYSHDAEKWKAYYLLLQIAFVLTQLLERGSLLRRLAAGLGDGVRKVFGSWQNIVRRLLESLGSVAWEESWFTAARKLRIQLDSS